MSNSRKEKQKQKDELLFTFSRKRKIRDMKTESHKSLTITHEKETATVRGEKKHLFHNHRSVRERESVCGGRIMIREGAELS